MSSEGGDAEALLFSPDPVVRWTEALRHRTDPVWSIAAVRERYPWWPRFWFGSVNAWLLFLGPSPGKSGSRAINWERDQFPTLGQLNEHVRTFPDSQGFWDRLREWITKGYGRGGVFGRKEREAALAMTMLGNVSDAEAGKATDITPRVLSERMPLVLRTLDVIRPGLIVPMDKRITPMLRMGLENVGWSTEGSGVTEVAAKNQTYRVYRPAWFQLARDARRIVIAESPMHPSRSNFYDPAEMDSYLGHMIRGARGDG